MALLTLDVAAIRHFCEQRVPPHALHQVRVEADVTSTAVTIVEVRAPWREDYGPNGCEGASRGCATSPSTSTGSWRDRNQQWHKYDLLRPSPDVLVLLDDIDRDPTGISWG
jgi:hypothetical protein